MPMPNEQPKNLAVITVMWEPRDDEEVLQIKSAITAATAELTDIRVEMRTTERRNRG